MWALQQVGNVEQQLAACAVPTDTMQLADIMSEYNFLNEGGGMVIKAASTVPTNCGTLPTFG